MVMFNADSLASSPDPHRLLELDLLRLILAPANEPHGYAPDAVPDPRTVGPDPDGPSEKQFHAATRTSRWLEGTGPA
jgi:hypothetical protein